MESRTTNNDISAIKEVRELSNELRSSLFLAKKQRKFEKNFVE